MLKAVQTVLDAWKTYGHTKRYGEEFEGPLGYALHVAFRKLELEPEPIPLLLWCPLCHARHVDEGAFTTKPHHTHACQTCGLAWRPAVEPTVGVRFLPGFKDPEGPKEADWHLENDELKP